jgi:hypothetical protein
MARTAEAAALTEQHRRAQLQIRAQALRDFMVLWPLWTGTAETFDRLAAATVPLVAVHHRTSAALAAAYFTAFRRADRAPGSAPPRLADPPDSDQVVSSLVVTGRIQTGKAIAAGQPPDTAMRTALTRTSGTVTRTVLAGGRDTLARSAEEDRQAVGWQRVADGNACAFCALLASRGPAYSEEGAGFEAHDHCGCGAEPAYEGSALPATSQRYRDLYDAHARGTQDPLNNLRRALEGRTA